MCGHNGEFDDPMTGKCVICADDPSPKEEYVGWGTPEHKVQKFGNKTRWRADANVGLRKIEKLISLSRSLISELTELGFGPIHVFVVGQAGCTFEVAGEEFSFTCDGELTALGVGRNISQGAAGANIKLRNAKGFSVSGIAKTIKGHLESLARVKAAS